MHCLCNNWLATWLVFCCYCSNRKHIKETQANDTYSWYCNKNLLRSHYLATITTGIKHNGQWLHRVQAGRKKQGRSNPMRWLWEMATWNITLNIETHFVEIFAITNNIIHKWHFKQYYTLKYQTLLQSLDVASAITGDNYPFGIFKLFLRAANISIKTPPRYTKYD